MKNQSQRKKTQAMKSVKKINKTEVNAVKPLETQRTSVVTLRT